MPVRPPKEYAAVQAIIIHQTTPPDLSQLQLADLVRVFGDLYHYPTITWTIGGQQQEQEAGRNASQDLNDKLVDLFAGNRRGGELVVVFYQGVPDATGELPTTATQCPVSLLATFFANNTDADLILFTDHCHADTTIHSPLPGVNSEKDQTIQVISAASLSGAAPPTPHPAGNVLAVLLGRVLVEAVQNPWTDGSVNANDIWMKIQMKAEEKKNSPLVEEGRIVFGGGEEEGEVVLQKLGWTSFVQYFLAGQTCLCLAPREEEADGSSVSGGEDGGVNDEEELPVRVKEEEDDDRDEEEDRPRAVRVGDVKLVVRTRV
ncbi:hypothetical protein QBC44DRAFT_370397 [Cladorrhinum sp. PSN332]|nr:hypothetical protein QBC44DRAFT_370397 [Cladorrhinum sp. PSN332]